MMIYVYIFVFSSLLSFFKNKKNSLIICSILLVILGFFAGTRDVGIDHDSFMYKHLFINTVRNGFKFTTEPTIELIPIFFKFFTEEYVKVSFLIYAIISLSIKLFSIRLFKFFSLAVILYVSNLYFIQDFTTIRASISSAILLWMLPDLYNKDDKKIFFKIFLAFLFHNSSILFVLIWIINKYNIKFKWLLLLLGFSILVPILNLNFIQILYLDKIFPKAAVYLKVKEHEEGTLNLYNFKIIFSVLYFIVLYFYQSRIKFKGLDLLLKIHLLSLILFFVFSVTGFTFSLRTFELLSIIQIILYPLLIDCFPKKSKLFGYAIVIVTSVLFFYYNIYVSENFKDYSSWLF